MSAFPFFSVINSTGFHLHYDQIGFSGWSLAQINVLKLLSKGKIFPQGMQSFVYPELFWAEWLCRLNNNYMITENV